MTKLKSKYHHKLKELNLTDQQADDLIGTLAYITEAVLTKKFMLGVL